MSCPKQQEEACDEPNPDLRLVCYKRLSSNQGLIELVTSFGWQLEVFKADNFILSCELHLCDLLVCIFLKTYRHKSA